MAKRTCSSIAIGVISSIVIWMLSPGTTISVPAGTSSGRRLRLRGRGLPNPRGQPGDLYAEARIMVPPELNRHYVLDLAPGRTAAALVAVLLVAHRERPADLGAPQLAAGDLEMLLDQQDLAMLDDDIEFYSWLEDQPELAPGSNGDGVG